MKNWVTGRATRLPSPSLRCRMVWPAIPRGRPQTSLGGSPKQCPASGILRGAEASGRTIRGRIPHKQNYGRITPLGAPKAPTEW